MDINVNKSVVEEFKDLNRDDIEFKKKCIQLVNEIKQGNVTFLQFVEDLKQLLVDTSPTNREHGMSILSQVLDIIPHDQILPAQLSFLCTFYADRLNDHHQVIPATLKGILALLKFEEISGESVKQFLNFLFQKISCQQQQQIDRLCIFQILKTSLEKKLPEMQEMGFDFVYGVTLAIDGERDPRNLLFLFEWIPIFLKCVTLGHLAEEMFEVMACYFPIDFRAPPQDPNRISRETLSEALCRCLCGVPEFSEFCLPLALEKLSSSLQIAKIDSLNILAEGCKIFPVSAYIQHSTDIWSQIQREVFNCNDQELAKIALNTLRVVMRKLSESSDNIYKPILSDITDTLKGNLLPHMKLFMPSCKILQAVSSSSRIASTYVTQEIVPALINTYNMTTTTSHQVLILTNLINFVTSYTELVNNNNINEVKELASVPYLCLKASVHENTEVAVVGLQTLVVICKSLPLEVRKCLYENLCSSITCELSAPVRNSLLECFKAMAIEYSDEIQNHVLDQIKINNNVSLHYYLESLRVIVQIEKFTESVLNIFIHYCGLDLATSEIAIHCLKHLVEQYEDDYQIQDILENKGQIISKLLNFVVNYLNEINIELANHKRLLCNISIICKNILSNQGSDLQKQIVSSNLDSVVALYKNTHKSELIVLYDGLITCLRQDVIECDVVEDLLNVALNVEEEFIQDIAVQLLANILNKKHDDTSLEDVLNEIEAVCNKQLENVHKSRIQYVINLISWITKALLMRGHIKSQRWTKKLLTLLERYEEAARGFLIVMKDNCFSLSTKSHSNIRLLYRQRFFMEITTILTQNYTDENNNYLLAVGYLLQEAPKQVFVMHFKKIVKIVILCLEKCENANTLFVLLETLCDLIQNKEPITEEYIQELLPRFLSLTTFKLSMNVRIKALQCIQHFSSGYPLYKLLPNKQNIVQSLTVCLDDKKRLVRKEAVDARLSWIMLDMPT